MSSHAQDDIIVRTVSSMGQVINKQYTAEPAYKEHLQR